MAQIFSILLFITYVYYLGRISSPILTKKLKGISETEEVRESEEERNIEIETISEGERLTRNRGPKKILLLPFFRRKSWIRAKSMKQKSYD
ncbi:hypothetical protein Godav_025936 [Gossypium davidsonii]|uniref:Translocon at the inner envelope membrane of chloroplasts 214 n=1 Tax=Gossypium davidsonii TaxID=34287 RepID=A0A7J8TE04_GOSDV|nr:hypothetical protein [Gossypium davidsonii]